MRFRVFAVIAITVFANAAALAGGGAMVKLSTFGRSEFCSIAAGPDGTLHAIFTDSPAIGKPHYLYYRASKDAGATWSDPKNLSDDESGLSAAYCRAIFDGNGRLYAIWKYHFNELLDGPGGYSAGVLAYRCLDGGNWSKIIRFNDKPHPMTSWFAALGPDKTVNVIWSQLNTDVDWTGKAALPGYANLLNQSRLDGTTLSQPKHLIDAKPVPTDDQIKAARAANHPIPYQDQSPQRNGLWNLRGYIDSTGSPHIICEHEPVRDPKITGQLTMLFTAGKLSKVYEYQVYKTYNNFNNPPTLLLDGKSKEHLIRSPEEDKSEHASLRDYSVSPDGISDPDEIIAPNSGPGKITHWQASSLADGRLAAMASLSQKGGYNPDDIDLYLTLFDGANWSEPINVTDNSARTKFSTNAGASIQSTYAPTYSEAISLKDGGVALLMVNTEHNLAGVNTVGITDSGRAVTGVASVSTDSPWVFYYQVK